jgi:hypothetical protein
MKHVIALLLLLAASSSLAKDNLQSERNRYAASRHIVFMRRGHHVSVEGTRLRVYYVLANQRFAHRMNGDWVIPQCAEMKKLGFTSVELHNADHTVHHWNVSDNCSQTKLSE